jgi:hypothetical protein
VSSGPLARVHIYWLVCTDPRVTGGGYSLPARAEYFPFLQSLQKALSAEVGEVGVAALEYCEFVV